MKTPFQRFDVEDIRKRVTDPAYIAGFNNTYDYDDIFDLWENRRLITVQGRLQTDGTKVWVAVDADIVNLARSLIPNAKRPQPQRYPPHITVIRNELVPAHLDLADRDVWFTYDPEVIEGEVYWWLRCWSLELTSLRISLGLSPSSELSRPPDGEDCFHITVGNKKRQL